MGDDSNERKEGADQSAEKTGLKSSQQSAESGVISGQPNQEVHGEAFAATHANDLRPSDPSLVATKDGETLEEYRARVEAIKNNPFVLVDSSKPGNGSAEDTGTVLDYKHQQLDRKTFAVGMDYEEGRDVRTSTEKLQDFVAAATKRATDPEGWKAWMQGEIDKVIGIGLGLNEAKEETKHAAKVAWTALTDGAVVNFLSHPNAINDPMFHTIGAAFNAMAKDPDAVNHVLEKLGNDMMEASKNYSALPDVEKGKVIGKFAFFMINPEGSTEGGDLALKIADGVATHVDAAVMKAVEQTMAAARAAAPEAAQEMKQMLLEYLLGKGVNPQQFEYAGIPRGYLDDVLKAENDNFFAMSKGDNAFRGDSEPFSRINTKTGGAKSYIDTAGDLTPPDPNGLFKGEPVDVVQHICGGFFKYHKRCSPFTSFSESAGIVAKYGDRYKITLDMKSLESAIAKAEVKGVEIIPHEKVLELIKNSPCADYSKRRAMQYAIADNELLIRGVIPRRFFTLEDIAK